MASFDLTQSRQEASRFRTLAALAKDPTLIASYSRIADSYDRLARVVHARESVNMPRRSGHERGVTSHKRAATPAARQVRLLHTASGA